LLETNRDVRIYIENMFDQTPELLQRLAQKLSAHPNFGVCFDLAHASITATPVEHWVGALAPYIRHCHLSDCDGQSDCHWPLGRGVLDFPRFFELLRRHRIKASLVIEVEGIEAQRKSLAYLKSCGLTNIAEPDF
jgi:sugar phosphate isomerase/epimerase